MKEERCKKTYKITIDVTEEVVNRYTILVVGSSEEDVKNSIDKKLEENDGSYLSIAPAIDVVPVKSVKIIDEELIDMEEL